ncbi:MAG: acyltransferase family protein [Rhodanobacter sp.]
MEARGYRLGYRGDIEGLRAIAILLVVAAHAKVTWLAGGFVGVDVFFVLSGYLITGVLLREIEQTSRLRFANFYARRFRRLLPALLVMIAVTSVVAAAVLAPSAQGAQATAAAMASMWLSNLHFAFAKLDYFSPGAASNLFLHTWSLGVEEQFYLIWPALMVLALAAWHAKGHYLTRLKITMFAIVGISLLASIVMTETAPQMAFYMMPLRAWQFGAGALVWLYFGSSSATNISKTSAPSSATSYWLGWSGLALIIAAGLFFNANMPYPGWRALLPTIGAVAIIMAGASGTDRGVSRALSWRPLQAVGHVSYSWYLWHWPVLLLGGTLITTNSLGYRIGLVVLSLLLAVMSYRWVEAPIRRQSRWTARPPVTILTALSLMVITVLACLTWFNAATSSANNPALQRYAQARADTPIIYRMGCDEWYHSDQVHPCTFGPSDATHTAVLMGDSIGAQWFPAVASVFNRPDWRLIVLTKSSCPMVDEPMFYPRIGRDYTECTTWREHALQLVASLRPDVVLLGSVQTYDFTQAQWLEGSVRVLKTISPTSGHIYILRGTPHLPFDGPNCLASQSWLSRWRKQKNRCQAPAFNQQDNNVDHWLQLASNQFGNVSVVDLNDKICPNGMCAAARNGEVIFRDSQHLTASFVLSLDKALGARIGMTVTPKATTQAK